MKSLENQWRSIKIHEKTNRPQNHHQLRYSLLHIKPTIFNALGWFWGRFNSLSKYFGEEVTLPIRAHVASKRYLAAVEDGYYDQLSEASKESLKVQGGIFTKEEAEEFINKPQM